MWLDTQHGWSIDEDWLYEEEIDTEQLAESDRIRDHVLEILGQRSLDPDCEDWPDLALMEGDECRLN